MKRSSGHVFAIVRVDEFLSSDSPWCNRVTVKEIVKTQEEAQREVERLNEINQGKGCTYFWQVTRLVGIQLENKTG